MKPTELNAQPYFPHKTVNTTPDRFGIPAQALVFSGTYAGSAYVDTTNNIAGFGLDDGQNNVAIGIIPFPPNWGGKYYRMSIAWIPSGTAAGTVRFGIGTRRFKDGSVVAALESIAPLYDAASGGTTITTVTVQNFATAFPTDIGVGEFLGFDVRRRADLSEDTYNADIYLIAVEISIR